VSTVYLNGCWIDEAEATIPADDAGFLQGDAVFETGRLVPGGYFRLDRHLERLAASAAGIDLPLPTPDALRRIVRGLAERNEFREATLRITVTRGGRAGPGLLATLTPLPPDWRERAARGWRIVTADVRHPPPSALPPVKTPGRPHGLVARAQARRAGADDALLLTPADQVVEGPSWNVFWREDDTLYTPAPETGLLQGITRAAVLELAAAQGFEVRQGLFPRARLDAAQELFATMTSFGIVPIASLDGRDLPPAARRAATQLQAAYWSLVEAEAA
jgi:branched-chain amino acid aminotransferase